MAIPARIRLAGTIAATALCAAAATEAAAQTPPADGGAIVLNGQLFGQDVFANQTLDVVDIQEQITVSTSAQGNRASVAAENGAVIVQSDQVMLGSAVATTDMTVDGDIHAVVNATTQAGGNYLAVSAYDADLSIDAMQSNTGALVSATSRLGEDDARLLGGAVINASAISNTVAMYGEGSAVSGLVDQSSSATVRAYNRIETQYIPAEARVSSQAIVNAVAVTSGQTSGQALRIVQDSTGDFVEAESSANAGNAWDLAGRAQTSANQALLYNEGGSVEVESSQSNSAFVRAAATTTAYDYGRAEAHAQGAGNELSVGNNDLYIEIDSSQFNAGGVDVTATFSGTNGYDVYVGADAVGNSVTGYACSECAGYLEARNSQTNTGDVSATANTIVAGSGRAVVTGANAVGNSATYHVSRASH